MTLGVGIYTGWCAAALCLIIGAMFGMTCCSAEEEEDDYDNYNQGQQYQQSNAGSSMPGKQFV